MPAELYCTCASLVPAPELIPGCPVHGTRAFTAIAGQSSIAMASGQFLQQPESECAALRKQIAHLEQSRDTWKASMMDAEGVIVGLREQIAAYENLSEYRTIADADAAMVRISDRYEAALKQIAALTTLLDTPETENFDLAVPLEAAHQVRRWGADHDAGKAPEDWFWLLGYLGGKALASQRGGDSDKAKHHCISSAAVLRNWHAHIRAGESRMRPGVSAEKNAALPEDQR